MFSIATTLFVGGTILMLCGLSGSRDWPGRIGGIMLIGSCIIVLVTTFL